MTPDLSAWPRPKATARRPGSRSSGPSGMAAESPSPGKKHGRRWQGHVLAEDGTPDAASVALRLLGAPRGFRAAPLLGHVRTALVEQQGEAARRPKCISALGPAEGEDPGRSASPLGIRCQSVPPPGTAASHRGPPHTGLLLERLHLPVAAGCGNSPQVEGGGRRGDEARRRPGAIIVGDDSPRSDGDSSPVGAGDSCAPSRTSRSTRGHNGSPKAKRHGDPPGTRAVVRPSAPVQACDLAKSCRKNCEVTERSQHLNEAVAVAAKAISTQNYLHEESPCIALGSMPPSRQGTEHGPVHGLLQRALLGFTSRSMAQLTVFEAYELAGRFNLPAGQVTQAWKAFKRYDSRDVGMLTSIEFQLLLRSLLRERYPNAKDIPRQLFKRALRADEDVTFMEFLTWITENSFSELVLLSTEQRMVRDMARKFQAPVSEVEGIKLHFDKFDNNHSGSIEYHEFAHLLHVLLKVKDNSSLPESRTLAFWRELDADCSGIVEFQEFLPWYLSYFSANAHSSPIEEYYRNIRFVPFPLHSAAGS